MDGNKKKMETIKLLIDSALANPKILREREVPDIDEFIKSQGREIVKLAGGPTSSFDNLLNSFSHGMMMKKSMGGGDFQGLGSGSDRDYFKEKDGIVELLYLLRENNFISTERVESSAKVRSLVLGDESDEEKLNKLKGNPSYGLAIVSFYRDF